MFNVKYSGSVQRIPTNTVFAQSFSDSVQLSILAGAVSSAVFQFVNIVNNNNHNYVHS